MKYAYFPGCSSVGSGISFERSAQYVAKKVGVELAEIPDWNCCGAGHMPNHDATIALPARNLALAEKMGLDEVVTPCAACFARLKTASVYCRQSEENLKHISDIIEMPFEAKNDVISLLEVFSRDEAKEAIKAAITKPLNGVKVASYYGCLLVRPEGICDFDDNENPMSMDNLMAIAGATPVDWAFKVECCGASHQVALPKVGREMISKVIMNAVDNGAEAIVTACPLCMLNLDMRMKEVAAKHGSKYNIPVYFFTELLAAAMGADPKELGTNKHFVPAVEFLENAVKPVAKEEKKAVKFDKQADEIDAKMAKEKAENKANRDKVGGATQSVANMQARSEKKNIDEHADKIDAEMAKKKAENKATRDTVGGATKSVAEKQARSEKNGGEK